MNITITYAFTDFFLDPSRDRLSALISGLAAAMHILPEEDDTVDFKKEWTSKESLARHILAMANSGGGIIIHGADQADGKFVAAGLPSRKDKAEINKQVKDSVPDNLEWELRDFVYRDDHPELPGKISQVILISDKYDIIPFVSKKDGTGIYKNRICCRQRTESEEANNDRYKRCSSVGCLPVITLQENCVSIWRSLRNYMLLLISASAILLDCNFR